MLRSLRAGLGPLLAVFLVALTAILPATTPAGAQAPDYDIPGGHFYTQANGSGGAGGTGFAVTDEGGIAFWGEFRRLGGVDAIGYPISRRFIWNGFTVQAFQKVVLQWRPEVGQAYIVNVIDELHNRGLDQQLAAFKSTPPVADWSSDTGLDWDQVVARHQALADADPAIWAKYYDVDDPVLRYGLPMAPLLDLGDVVVLRAQRVIIQHWKVQTPWANPGDVLLANGADVAKELGLFPAAVLVPEPPGGGSAQPVTPVTPLAPAAGLPRFGIVGDPANPAELQRIKEAGANLVVLAAVWREIEPTNTSPDRYNWGAVESRFENARRAGLTPLVIVTGNPTWAWTAGNSGIIKPESMGDFAEFVGALVNRYKGYTTLWSFYNEPDCNGPVTPDIHASCWGNQGAAYAQMLKTVYPAVKRADANARVVFGGIAFDNFQPERAYARQFLDDTLAAGAGQAFDVFNFHYYTGFRSSWEQYGTDVIGKATFLRSVLARYGLSKPMILTEIGSGSQGPGESQELQARYVAQSYTRGAAAGIESIFWYDAADPGPYGFGLLTGDLRPRPSFAAYQTTSRTLADRAFRRALTSADLGAAEVEAYEFVGSHAQVLVVAWSTDGASRRIQLPANGARVVALNGAESAAGASGGVVSVNVGPDPVFVELR